MKKILRIGTIEINGAGTKRASVYIKVEFDKHLSISGVIGPLSSGNALGGCGQIDMEFEHQNEKDNDERYKYSLIKADSINFTKGWNRATWFELLNVWKDYHLKEKVPETTMQFLNRLADSDKTPAWC